MGKKPKNNNLQEDWMKLKMDLDQHQMFAKDDPIFEKVSENQFQEKIIHPVLTSGKNLPEVLDQLISWKDYLVTRSDRLSKSFNEKIDDTFREIRITLQQPFDEAKWHELETMDQEDLNKKIILLNEIPFTTSTLVTSLEKLLTKLDPKIEHIEVFPFEVDSFGLPPINCKKIWNPLLWMHSEIESKVRKHCQPEGPLMDQIVTCLAKAPKEGHFQKLAVTSFFLENTADNLDYTKSENREKFFENLKQQFGSLEVDELTMVLPDILLAYTEELLEGVMQVCYFIPFELLRLLFLCWRPKVLKLRLRTEACSSIEDAARIEWDEEEVFTSTTLFNCPLFDRCDPVCLGKEDSIVNCDLIVDATGSRLFDPVYNEQNADTAGRDFLVVFPMKNLLIKRTASLKNGASIKTQLKQQFDFVVNTLFFNVEQHHSRMINYQLTILNAGDLQISAVKKCLPRTANGRRIGVAFSADVEVEERFLKLAGPVDGKVTYASYFDEIHDFVVDLKIVICS